MTRLPKPLRAGEVQPRYADAGDLLRVLCTLLVSSYHIWQQSWLNPRWEIAGVTLNFRNQVATGYLGVDLLLMLSGFLLYLPYVGGETPRLRDFYRKRALRILPSYWLCLLILLLTYAIPHGLYADTPAMLRDLAAHATFTHNLFQFSYFATPLNGALWTLAVEVQFYLIAPFLCRAFRKRPAIVYGAMLLLAQAYRYLVVSPMQDTTYFLNRLPNLLTVYANGMLAAHIYGLLCQRKQRWWDTALCTALFVGSIFFYWRLSRDQGMLSGYEPVRVGQMDRRFLLSATGAVFLVCGSRSLQCVRWLCSNRLIRFLSSISLNFYIWHQFLAVRLKEWHIPASLSDTPHMDGEQPWQWQYTLLCFAAAFAAALLATYLVEKPVVRLANKWRKSQKNNARRS